jgi:hypothetical protein
MLAGSVQGSKPGEPSDKILRPWRRLWMDQWIVNNSYFFEK